MKKVILAAALVMLSFIGYSQVQVALGIKAGPNFANIDTKSTLGENYDGRTGFHGGAFALFKLTKIGIQPELLFSQQGTTINFNGNDLKQNYSYMNIPVMIKFYLIGGLNLQAGPQFGFITKAEGETIDIQTGDVTTEDIKDELKGSDISVGLGAGWDLPFGLTLDARYNLGLSKVNDSAGSEDAKNQVFQISVGFKLLKFGK
jgi:Outer membrane protein beta-barrel domain